MNTKIPESPNDASSAEAPMVSIPFAIVKGQPLLQVPKDLYIPPEAMKVFLETFEGPLDLLLYLIRKQNLDILDIQVSDITAQYMRYIDMMERLSLELAGDYLVMASLLARIKSRLLIPRTEIEAEEEADPRAELVKRLQEYEQIKIAAEELDELPRLHRDYSLISPKIAGIEKERPQAEVDLKELFIALADVLNRMDLSESHQVEMEALSTRERMTSILNQINSEHFIPFTALFQVEEGRHGVVVTFLAVLELVRESLIECVQNELFGPIHVKARA